MVLERKGDFSLIWLGFTLEKERKEEEKKKKNPVLELWFGSHEWNYHKSLFV